MIVRKSTVEIRTDVAVRLQMRFPRWVSWADERISVTGKRMGMVGKMDPTRTRTAKP